METLSCVTTAISKDVPELMELSGQKSPNFITLSLAVISRLLCIYKVIIGSEDKQQIITTDDSVQNEYFLKILPVSALSLISSSSLTSVSSLVIR